MWLKYAVAIVLFLLVFTIQYGFTPAFLSIGFSPNLIFALFFILLFAKNPTSAIRQLAESGGAKNHRETGLFFAAIAGVLSDIFLFPYFGPSIISFIVIVIFIKIIFNLIKEPVENKILVYFIICCAIFFILHNVILVSIAKIFQFSFNFSAKLFISDLLSTVFFAAAGFFVYRVIMNKLRTQRQLKLL